MFYPSLARPSLGSPSHPSKDLVHRSIVGQLHHLIPLTVEVLSPLINPLLDLRFAYLLTPLLEHTTQLIPIKLVCSYSEVDMLEYDFLE